MPGTSSVHWFQPQYVRSSGTPTLSHCFSQIPHVPAHSEAVPGSVLHAFSQSLRPCGIALQAPQSLPAPPFLQNPHTCLSTHSSPRGLRHPDSFPYRRSVPIPRPTSAHVRARYPPSSQKSRQSAHSLPFLRSPQKKYSCFSPVIHLQMLLSNSFPSVFWHTCS